MQTFKLHLIRTGKTEDGMARRYVGQSDPSLCREGREELLRLQEEFAYPKVDLVVTSPLIRCRQTADLLFPDVQMEEHAGLRDLNLGRFEGYTFEELRGDQEFADWLGDSIQNTPPGGEEMTAFSERLLSAVDDIFTRMTRENRTSVALVTHRGVIMTLLAAIGLPQLPIHQWTVDNGCGYTLLMSAGMWMRDRRAEVAGPVPVLKEYRGDEDDVWE